MHERREQLIRNITDCANSLVYLEGHLRTLSASTLSTCSSSLSTDSSQQSLPDAVLTSAVDGKSDEMKELKRRLQHLILSRTQEPSVPPRNSVAYRLIQEQQMRAGNAVDKRSVVYSVLTKVVQPKNLRTKNLSSPTSVSQKR